jgi:hypothetical protein
MLKYSILNVTVWPVLRKHLKAYKLSIVQHLELRIVCAPLIVNIFVALAIEQHLKYYCKAFLKQPALPVEVAFNRNYPRYNSVCFATIRQSKTLFTSSKWIHIAFKVVKLFLKHPVFFAVDRPPVDSLAGNRSVWLWNRASTVQLRVLCCRWNGRT